MAPNGLPDGLLVYYKRKGFLNYSTDKCTFNITFFLE